MTVDDGKGGIDTDEITITIEDTLPPIIAVQWVHLKYKGDKKVFRVELSAEDICDPQPQVIGIIETPSLAGFAIKLKQDDDIKIKFDLKKKRIVIQGPDPAVLLNQLQTYGGIVIQDGQRIKVDIEHKDKKQQYEFEDGWLEIDASSAILKVMAEDASGNKAEVCVSPETREWNHEHDEHEDNE